MKIIIEGPTKNVERLLKELKIRLNRDSISYIKVNDKSIEKELFPIKEVILKNPVIKKNPVNKRIQKKGKTKK